MSSIDQRIVEMKFDNAQFANGIKTTLEQLAALKTGLKLEGASKGLDEVNATASKFSLDGMKQHLSGVLGQFTALQVAAITALTNIVNKAVEAGLQIAKSLTIEPVMAGFREYETNLSSIQTILANTGLKGADGLHKVNEALDKLNEYSDQTIYNFSEMAKNIGTFTAAGVDLDVATQAIKGIANLAAISGSNSQQASTAMYQLSQALSAGKLTLEDWNSVVNAGMGGEVFRNSLIETARVHGVSIDKILKDAGSFRNSLEKGWITGEILTETLSKFTGELTADQLKSMGYTKQQIAGILEMGVTATDAATKVKTMSQLLGTLRESVGSGWAQTWEIIFGDFDEAKTLFTGVNDVLGGMIKSSAEARNNLLEGWKELGGRDALIEGIGNAFKALLAILKPIKDAFRQIFPATTAKQLFDMTVSFRDFMAKLKIGAETANNLRRTFAGFFAILGIGWELIKAGVKFVFDLVGSLTQGSGGFLKFTGSVGDFLVMLHQAIKDGQGFTKFFEVLGKILAIPIKLITSLASLIGKLFSGFDTGAAEASVNGLSSALKPLGSIGEKISQIWSKITQTFSNFMSVIRPMAQQFMNWAKDVGSSVSEALGGINFDNVLDGLQTGLLAGLVLLLKNFLSNLNFFGANGDFLDGIKDALDGLTGALKGMQNALNAAALLAIAAAIGILTLSFVALSKIDSAGVARASTAIAIMMGQLGLAFVAFNRISTGGSALKVAAMSVGLILLATAVRVLASSVAKLAGIPIEELRKGLIAVALLLTMMVAATKKLNTNTAGIIRTATGLIVLGVALRVLVSSVKELGELDWNSLAKGLVGVGVLLGSLALFTKLAAANKGGIAQSAGIILLATALKILASAVGDFAKYNWEELAQGMTGIAVGLGIIAGALRLIPDGAVFKAAGLVIVAASLKMIADGVQAMSQLKWDEIARGMVVLAGALGAIALAIKLLPSGAMLNAAGILIVAASLQLIQQALGNMSGMSWEEIAKGLTVLAASLILIAAAIRVVQGAISGAAAILIVAAALNLLVPVLTSLGAMTWEEIIKGLVGLAGVFLILGGAALLLGPLVPVIFGLAAGISLLALAVLAAGVGVLAFAVGLTVLAAAGAGATAAIIAIVSGLVGLIPYVMEQIGLGLIAFAKVIAVSGPAITEAIVTVLNSILDAIIQATPKIVQTLLTMLEQMLNALVQAVPKMVDAGAKMLIGVFQGIARNIGKIVDAAADIIVNFLNGISRNLPRIIQSGIDLVISFMNGIGDGIRNNGAKIADAGINMATGIVEGVIKGLGQLVRKVVDAAINLAKQMWDGILDFFGINSPSKKMIWASKQMALGLAVGLDDYSYLAANAAEGVGKDVIGSMSKTLSGLSKVLGSDLIDFQPTIAPVLDLTAVKKDAADISRILALPPLDVSGTYGKAKTAGSTYEENRSVGEELVPVGGGNTYNYTQNNNSPKALSEAEIYRQTKNLISRVKGEDDA